MITYTLRASEIVATSLGTKSYTTFNRYYKNYFKGLKEYKKLMIESKERSKSDDEIEIITIEFFKYDSMNSRGRTIKKKVITKGKELKHYE